MKTRYVRMSDGSPPMWYNDPPSHINRDARDVLVTDSNMKFTGIYDQRGDPLYRLPNPIGFNRH